MMRALIFNVGIWFFAVVGYAEFIPSPYPPAVPQRIFKFLVVGDRYVGKSALIARLHNDLVLGTLPQTRAMNITPIFFSDNTRVFKAVFWDSPGITSLRSYVSSWSKGSDGVVIVYDTSNKESFAVAQYWVAKIRNTLKQPSPPLLLLANKIESEPKLQEVSKTEGLTFAQRNELLFSEVSLRDGMSIAKSFSSLIDRLAP